MTTAVYAEALEAGLAETAQTFVDAAKDVQKSVSNETVLVVVTYFDAAGVELASQSFLRGLIPGGWGAAQMQRPSSLMPGANCA
ncbi:MAG: hypothetical protein ACLT5P_04240 [Flavonifractor plautii]